MDMTSSLPKWVRWVALAIVIAVIVALVAGGYGCAKSMMFRG